MTIIYRFIALSRRGRICPSPGKITISNDRSTITRVYIFSDTHNSYLPSVCVCVIKSVSICEEKNPEGSLSERQPYMVSAKSFSQLGAHIPIVRYYEMFDASNAQLHSAS